MTRRPPYFRKACNALLGLLSLISIVLAIGLMRLLYPRDRRTLGVLRRKLKQISRRPEC